MKQEHLMKNKIMAICEKLFGWLMDEVVDPFGEYHLDGKFYELRLNHLGPMS